MANASKDDKKILPFNQGVDGHSLNAFSYFNDELTEIQDRVDYQEKSDKFYKIELKGTEQNVWYVGNEDVLLQSPDIINKEEIDKQTCWIKTINLVKKYFKSIRDKSKPYTFGFSYGASEKKYGVELYNAYWKLYAKTKKYNEEIVKEATKTGAIISRYSGLRLLAYDLLSKDPFAREKAQRVVANFNIQSGNILTLYAMVKLQKLIEEEDLIDDVKIVNTVHDSIYLYVKNDLKTVDWVNKKLIECMVSDYNSNMYEEALVKLEAELDIGNNMSEVTTMANDASFDDISDILSKLKKD